MKEDTEEREIKIVPMREVWKPDISKLPDAVVDGKLLVPVGGEMVIQYPEPWRETVLWKIVHVYPVDSPLETVECEVMEKNEVVKRKFTCVKGTTVRPGHVRLIDMVKGQYGATNFLEAASHGLVLKVWIPPTKKK